MINEFRVVTYFMEGTWVVSTYLKQPDGNSKLVQQSHTPMLSAGISHSGRIISEYSTNELERMRGGVTT